MLTLGAEEVTNILTQLGVGGATLGALIWSVSKIGSVGHGLWEQISESQREQMEATISSLKTVIDENRRAEAARTDAQIAILTNQVTLLSRSTEALIQGLGTVVKSNQDLRESVHGIRNAANELVSAHALLIHKSERKGQESE